MMQKNFLNTNIFIKYSSKELRINNLESYIMILWIQFNDKHASVTSIFSHYIRTLSKYLLL